MPALAASVQIPPLGRLEALLKQECALFTEYQRLTAAEEQYITKFDAERLTKLTEQRSILLTEIAGMQEHRLALMRAFPAHGGMRLRELVLKYYHPREAKNVIRLIDQLGRLVQDTKRQGSRHNQIVSFGLKAVNGILSLLWSATQNVVKSYTRQGSLRQSYHPSHSRRSGIIKQA